jgi:glucose-fructose oxidoreductase
MMKRWRIAGINFDHLHMGDNLRMAYEHPHAEIVGICDERPERMERAIANFGIPPECVFTDYRECLEKTKPDIVLLCPATARHGEWTERVAPYGVHIIMEKPFAATLAEADRMIAATAKTGKRLAINWPLAWYPSHRTTKRLIDDGAIGRVIEVHYYDGNRGPLWHVADKLETTSEEVAAQKPSSWFYRREYGGGSLLDYLGYGVTLGTWFRSGETPIDVTAVLHVPSGLEVDEHSVTIARYETGLSKFETRWGTFTDPWVHQPQPKCGFVIVGTAGTIGSYDYEPVIRLQTRDCPEGRDVPVDTIEPPFQNPVQYVVHCIENNVPIEGPLSPAVSRIGQRLVDTALASARKRATLPLLGT